MVLVVACLGMLVSIFLINGFGGHDHSYAYCGESHWITDGAFVSADSLVVDDLCNGDWL